MSAVLLLHGGGRDQWALTQHLALAVTVGVCKPDHPPQRLTRRDRGIKEAGKLHDLADRDLLARRQGHANPVGVRQAL